MKLSNGTLCYNHIISFQVSQFWNVGGTQSALGKLIPLGNKLTNVPILKSVLFGIQTLVMTSAVNQMYIKNRHLARQS